MHVRSRTRKAFERVYKGNAVEVLEGMCELWQEQEELSSTPADSVSRATRIDFAYS